MQPKRKARSNRPEYVVLDSFSVEHYKEGKPCVRFQILAIQKSNGNKGILVRCHCGQEEPLILTKEKVTCRKCKSRYKLRNDPKLRLALNTLKGVLFNND